MGNGALLLRESGHEVFGSDQGIYPPMSDRLIESGITVYEGFDVARLQSLAPDMVVVGNVNTRGNPEIEWLLETRAIPFVSLPEILAREVLNKRSNIVITGTHGKTTTSALCAYLLEENGFTPGYLVGGVVPDLPSGSRVGDPAAPFVIEGDEYDSAFFDKRSKFIHYAPRTVVLNNLEFDHADIFRDLEDIRRNFRHMLKLVPGHGRVLANVDDPDVVSLLDFNWAPVYKVGLAAEADLRIEGFAESPEGSQFELLWHDQLWAKIAWTQWGLHNARNLAMAALGAALTVSPDNPVNFSLDSIGKFQGVRRRQEILYESPRVTVVSDFAHHPTALEATLKALRARFPGRKLVAAFEARSNTACRKLHEASFIRALAVADEVHLAPVYRAERYPVEDRLDPVAIAGELGTGAIAHESHDALKFAMNFLIKEGDGIVMSFFSNGSFEGIPSEVVKQLRE